tara:strand:- start:749 stop:1048 length:300 start_codon:yes stop_codon:yes gene_type:complete
MGHIENVEGVKRVRPYPEFYGPDNMSDAVGGSQENGTVTSYCFIGLGLSFTRRKNRRKQENVKVDLTPAVNEFLSFLTMDWMKRLPSMTISINYLRRYV